MRQFSIFSVSSPFLSFVPYPSVALFACFSFGNVCTCVELHLAQIWIKRTYNNVHSLILSLLLLFLYPTLIFFTITSNIPLSFYFIYNLKRNDKLNSKLYKKSIIIRKVVHISINLLNIKHNASNYFIFLLNS